MLHPDRYFSAIPAVRDVARELYASAASLPLVCPHGHVDPKLLALDEPFPDPSTLIVIPDHYRVDRSGRVVERKPGLKRVAVRGVASGGTVEESVRPELVERLCLDDEQLGELNRLAARCEEIYGDARDIEWAVANGTLYLLQCRAITKAGR